MPTLIDFRRRIRSVKNTQQITRAMKFVAAAKLRRAQERVFGARPYARQIIRVLRREVAACKGPLAIYSVLVHPAASRFFAAIGCERDMMWQGLTPSGAALHRFQRR